TVTSNRNLVAYFELIPIPTYNVTVTANPTAGGTVSGGGTYDEGETVTITAVANANYIFVNWTENGTELSTSAVYSFEVTRDINITANFSDITGVEENSVAVEVYPNPANAEMNIICERMKRITIISVSGKVVFDAEVANDKETVDLSRFSQGSYVLRISTSDNIVTRIVTVTK
ncbi:MAG: T9SS type A sorting domain-containing protein, partial [Bacteroidales bacterium]|nr:T9SS type A sorting domain-containing protein [Bacteroidales bacterium]